MTKIGKKQQEDHLAQLKRTLQRDEAVFSILRHWTQYGTRYYDFYVCRDWEPYTDQGNQITRRTLNRITFSVAAVTGFNYDRRRECISTNSDAHDIVRALACKVFGEPGQYSDSAARALHLEQH